jgi:hypothetical protein
MEEVSNTGAVPETVQTESAAPQTEATQESTVAQTSEAQTTSQPDQQQDKSWIKKVRRDRDEAIKKAEEAERKAKLQEELIRQLMMNQGQTAQVGQEDVLQELQKEEYASGEKLAKVLKAQKEEFDKQLAELKKAQEQQYYARQETEIRTTYPDYEDVVNPETLDLLKDTNPKLANRVANLLKIDPMDGAIFAYETISQAGILDKIPGLRRSKEVEKKLEQNKKTVQSPQAFDKRPLAQAMSFADQKKAQAALWAETQRYASMSGGGY